MKIEDVVAMVDKATEEQVQTDEGDLYLIYDFYVISYYTGGDGEALTPASFVEFWAILDKEEKESFVRRAFM